MIKRPIRVGSIRSVQMFFLQSIAFKWVIFHFAFSASWQITHPTCSLIRYVKYDNVLSLCFAGVWLVHGATNKDMKNHNGYSPNRLLKRLHKALSVPMSSISFSRGITDEKTQNTSKRVEKQDRLMTCPCLKINVTIKNNCQVIQAKIFNNKTIK